ncbi:uncharacterized protein METZ01_LOCUS138380, partial [marine metagenome]
YKTESNEKIFSRASVISSVIFSRLQNIVFSHAVKTAQHNQLYEGLEIYQNRA